MKNPVDVRTKVKFKYIYRIQLNNKVPKQIHPKIVLNGIYTILIRNLFIQKILRSSQSRLWLSCKSWQNVYKIVNVQLPIIGNNSKLLTITTKSPFSSQELYSKTGLTPMQINTKNVFYKNGKRSIHNRTVPRIQQICTKPVQRSALTLILSPILMDFHIIKY